MTLPTSILEAAKDDLNKVLHHAQEVAAKAVAQAKVEYEADKASLAVDIRAALATGAKDVPSVVAAVEAALAARGL